MNNINSMLYTENAGHASHAGNSRVFEAFVEEKVAK